MGWGSEGGSAHGGMRTKRGGGVLCLCLCLPLCVRVRSCVHVHVRVRACACACVRLCVCVYAWGGARLGIGREPRPEAGDEFKIVRVGPSEI